MASCAPTLASTFRTLAVTAPRSCRLIRTRPPRACGRVSSRARGCASGVVISDTFGRAWREGQTNIAVGVSGVEALRHFEGQVDPTGYELRVTMLATADELASAAELVMGKVDRVPVAIIRGLDRGLGEGSAAELIRPAANDLFR